MANLNSIVSASVKLKNFNINNHCSIKKYLKTDEKIAFVKEYKDVVESHLEDFDILNGYIGYIYFNLLVIKYYTDIDIDMTYDSFDILQENGLIAKISEVIGEDYIFLAKIMRV